MNVLVLMSDQHSRFRLGCYGDPLVRTPNLDELAARGTRFESAYCPAPLCVPSRMSFLTGRTPSNNRVWLNSHVLSSGIPTWAHAMGAAGYETALIGRMHFVGSDQRHGFERRPVGEYWSNYPGAPMPGAPLFRRIPAGASGQRRTAPESAGVGATTYAAMDEIVAQAACDYLREKAQGGKRPFAAVVGFVLPHCPYFAPAELFDYYYPRVDVPQIATDQTDREPPTIRNQKARLDLVAPVPPDQIRAARAAYFALCEQTDGLVGRILRVLRETGLDRETLVVYTSDHGDMAGEHGLWGKSNYYEASAGVPLIFSMPGVVPEGIASPAICSLSDLAPTIVEAASAVNLPRVDGRSLWPLVLGHSATGGWDETFSELGGSYWGPPSRMIRSGDWKLFKYHDSTPPALFNLRDDPGEMQDLGAAVEHEGTRRKLLDRLYEDWDPVSVLRESERLDADLEVLHRWGEATSPRHEDVLDVPEVEDVEFR